MALGARSIDAVLLRGEEKSRKKSRNGGRASS